MHAVHPSKNSPSLIKLLTLFAILTGVVFHESRAADAQSTITKISDSALTRPLKLAEDNAPQIQRALRDAPEAHRRAMRFLVAHMPERDLKSLSADYLLANVKLAFQARDAAPWGKKIPEDIFFNDVLPYASINERRDDWRRDFLEKFSPLIENAKTPGEAAQILNRDMFKLIDVRYHASKRPKPDQSPYESIDAGYASCSGLSVLLIDACRAVGTPARFVGTKQWAGKRGNHSWVEIWDNGEWKFTGACEFNKKGLNKGWFQGNASNAIKDDPQHAIYASSWKQTGTSFPLVWDDDIKYVAAVNVTDRYAKKPATQALGPNETTVEIQILEDFRTERTACDFVITHNGVVIAKGKSKGPDDDTNNIFRARLKRDSEYWIRYWKDGFDLRRHRFTTSDKAGQRIEFQATFKTPQDPLESPLVSAFRRILDQPRGDRPPIDNLIFARTPLSRYEASFIAKHMLWKEHVEGIRESRAEEMKTKIIKHGELEMKFTYKVFGEKPEGGRSLFISMHGGGGAPKQINDQQWENQKRLYKLKEGVYLTPRAPTDTWNLWHQKHIDPMFDRLIENLIVFEDVNPNRVYLMGYSAGGDGVYQLAPRMADRFAAAAMMAGHPNETSPLGLRNLPFTLHVGGKDAAYKRNEKAREWRKRLADLKQNDPEGYPHQVVIPEDKGHWMDREDAVALPWMAKFTRNPYPNKIVWKQDDVFQSRFYWLAVDPKDLKKKRAEVRAEINGQTIDNHSDDVSAITVLLNHEIVNLHKEIRIRFNGEERHRAITFPNIATIRQSLIERPDPTAICPIRIRVTATD